MASVPVRVLLYTLVPTAGALVLTALVTGWYRRVRWCREDVRQRSRALAPFAAVLAGVLVFNGYLRPRMDDLSHAFGISLTDRIFAMEGYFVAALQDAVPGVLEGYFVFVYVVGYALLLLFPPVAYFVLDDLRHAKTLFTAYAINYFVGALLYLVFKTFGPRNIDVARSVYDQYPEMMFLTSTVNTSSNVFPSLHASLSVSVMLLAYYSRGEYPRWFAITAVLAPSVALSTMVLGIHWLTDVVAGVGLAVLSVAVARWVVPRLEHREQHPGRRAAEHIRL